MEQALADEYLVRCLTPNRSGQIKIAQHDGLLPSIFSTKIRRSDPRAVNAMAKYALAKNIVFRGSTPMMSTRSGEKPLQTEADIQISSKKSARLLATAIYYALKRVSNILHSAAALFTFLPSCFALLCLSTGWSSETELPPVLSPAAAAGR